jgi:transketolase
MPTMRDRFTTTTIELLDSNPRLAAVLADIGAAAFQKSPHVDRVVNLGIREQLLVGVSAGLALAGLRPIAHSYTPFLIERPLEQIKLDLGHQDLGAVLVSIGASYDAATEGRTHQAPEDVALLAALPGWTIHVPGHPDEAEQMLRAAAQTDDRVYIRLAADSNRRAHPVGHLAQIRAGSPDRATVVAVGPMLDPVLAATEGMEVNVLYTATARPFDRRGLANAATGTDVVLVEPYLEGTSASEIADALRNHPHRLLSIGVPNIEHRHYGTRQEHVAAHGLDAAGIHSRIAAFTH